MPFRKAPTEEEFETCADVISWLIDWFDENDPGGVEHRILQAAELEIPENAKELESEHTTSVD